MVWVYAFWSLFTFIMPASFQTNCVWVSTWYHLAVAFWEHSFWDQFCATQKRNENQKCHLTCLLSCSNFRKQSIFVSPLNFDNQMIELCVKQKKVYNPFQFSNLHGICHFLKWAKEGSIWLFVGHYAISHWLRIDLHLKKMATKNSTLFPLVCCILYLLVINFQLRGTLVGSNSALVEQLQHRLQLQCPQNYHFSFLNIWKHTRAHAHSSTNINIRRSRTARTIDTVFRFVSICDSWIAYQKVKPNVSPIAAIYFNLLLALCILSHDFVIFLRCLPAYYYYLIWFNMKISHCYWCSNVGERAGTEHHQCLLCAIYTARTIQHFCTNTHMYLSTHKTCTAFSLVRFLPPSLPLALHVLVCMRVIIVHYVL